MTIHALPGLPDTGGNLTAVRIGRVVRTIRTGNGWTRAEFALRLGVAESVASAIEDGQRVTTIEMLYRLAAALQVPPGDLLPSPEDRPRVDVHLPISDVPGSTTAQVIGGGPGNRTQSYLWELAEREDGGGFRSHPGEALLVVMDGEVVYSELDRADRTIGPGESLVLDTSVAHAVRGGDAGPTRFVIVCTDLD